MIGERKNNVRPCCACIVVIFPLALVSNSRSGGNLSHQIAFRALMTRMNNSRKTCLYDWANLRCAFRRLLSGCMFARNEDHLDQEIELGRETK